MLSLVTLRPFWAFLFIAAGMVVAAILGETLRSTTSAAWASAIEMGVTSLFYYGWPLLIGISIERHMGKSKGPSEKLAVASSIWVIAIALLVQPVIVYIDSPDRKIGTAVQMLVRSFLFFGTIVPLVYIFYFGSRKLVTAEEGQPARLRDCWGTLLQLLLSPLGLLFLQNRVRRVLLPADIEPERSRRRSAAEITEIYEPPFSISAGSLAERVMTLRPIVAFLLVVGGMASAVLCERVAGFWISRELAMELFLLLHLVIYCGWPLLAGSAAGRRVLPATVRQQMEWSSFFFALIIVARVASVFLPIPSLGTVGDLLFIGLAFVTVIGMIYILRFGAMTLVAAERGRPVRLDHYLGTLLLFYLLPIGVFFLQKRLRKLLLPSDAT